MSGMNAACSAATWSISVTVRDAARRQLSATGVDHRRVSGCPHDDVVQPDLPAGPVGEGSGAFCCGDDSPMSGVDSAGDARRGDGGFRRRGMLPVPLTVGVFVIGCVIVRGMGRMQM